jgi:membrane complex biogenesis BtpA family protein
MSASPVADHRDNALTLIFGRGKGVLIGMIHLLPIPGSPNYRGGGMRAILDRALADADAYAAAGFDGLVVENHGDIPFLKPDRIGPETAAYMAIVADGLRERFELPIGINVLANGAIHALAIAAAAEAAFVRVNQWANAYVANEGIIEGAAAEALRYRSALRAEPVRVFADAHVKHGAHAIVADRPVPELIKDVDFFSADAVIATGQRTGHAADLDYLRLFRQATDLPLLVGSGVTPDNVEAILSIVDGCIIGSAVKTRGVWWDPVDPSKAKALAGRAGRASAGR